MTISVTDTALDMEKQAIKHCVRRSRIRGLLACTYIAMFLMSFAGFYVAWYTNTLRDYVLSQIELRNGTQGFDWWQQPPIDIKYKIYIFNYTNVDEFEAGVAEKLRVQELGPYIYRETKSRVNVVINENGTVTYQDKRSYEWVGGRPDKDVVVVPNVPLMSTTAYVRDLNFGIRFLANTVLSTLQEQPFIKETANGFLWGYETQLFEMAKPLIQFERDIPFDNFGILAVKNGIDKNRITMHMKVDDLGTFELVNGMSSRNIWDDEQCDRISGTDGTMFPPHLIEDTSKTLDVYALDMCRKIPFRFAEHANAFGIPSLRYKIDMFNTSDPQNNCFCPKIHNSRACPPVGLFNLSACCYGTPFLSSFPHFYGADKSLLEQIDGLNPRQEAHESYIDIHPRIAMPMSGWSRVQMNVEVRKAIGVPFLGNLKDGTILPLIWFAAGTDELPEYILEMFRTAHFTVNGVEMTLQWGSLIIMILSLSALISCFWKYRAERKEAFRRNLSGQNNVLEKV